MDPYLGDIMFTQTESGALIDQETGLLLEQMTPFALMEAVRNLHAQAVDDKLTIANLTKQLQSAYTPPIDPVDLLPSMNFTLFPLGGRLVQDYFPPGVIPHS